MCFAHVDVGYLTCPYVVECENDETNDVEHYFFLMEYYAMCDVD